VATLRVPSTSRLLLKVEVALVPFPMKAVPATANCAERAFEVVPMPMRLAVVSTKREEVAERLVPAAL
jgi:hypothetical protein